MVILRENFLEKQSERGIKLRGPSPKGLKSMPLRTANSYRIRDEFLYKCDLTP